MPNPPPHPRTAGAYRLAQRLLRALPPEVAHRATLRALKAGLVPAAEDACDPILSIRVLELDFANPVGLAAGFDKDAEVVDAMLALGFGFVEAGGVTPRPQPGNPRPRVFRLGEDRAVINRLGFNSRGLAAFAGRLARRNGARGNGPLGVNLAKNKDTEDAAADYETGIETVAPFADFLVVNVSSPNTPGLRDLQRRAPLETLLRRAVAARDRAARAAGIRRPLLVKIAPDLDRGECADIAAAATATGVDGMIVGNTTTARPAGLHSARRGEAGGLSGRPLFDRSTECLRTMFGLTGGRLPLIGCGGVADGADAYAKIRAGASLVQLYTALIFQGPALVGRIKRELADRLRNDGFASVAAAVGADAMPPAAEAAPARDLRPPVAGSRPRATGGRADIARTA